MLSSNDHLGARGPKRVDRLHEHRARLGPERHVRGRAQLLGRRLRHGRRDAVERNAVAGEDERRHAESLALERVGLEIRLVRRPLRGAPARPTVRGVERILAGHHRERDRGVRGRARDRARCCRAASRAARCRRC